MIAAPRPQVAAVPVLLAAALLVAGCGSGSRHVSKAQYTRRGDAICRAYTRRLRALGTPDKLTEIAPYIAKALPILSQTVRRLGALRPPDELENAYRRYLSALRATRNRTLALRDAAAAADGEQVQRLLAQAARAGDDTDALARRAGLGACAV